MYVLAVNAQKGGVGKSTIAQHIAVLAEKSGWATAIVDFDPQGSSLSWANRRKERGITSPPVGHAGAKLQDALKAAQEDGFDLVILDTPPNVESPVIEASKAADLILLLVCPSPKDMDALGATARLVEQTGKPAVLLLNKGRGASINQEVLQLLGAQFGLAVCPMTISDRRAIMDADMNGATINEVESKVATVKNGQDEFSALWKWLKKRLEGSKNVKVAKRA